MPDFKTQVKQYAELDAREKAIKKEKDPLNKAIKGYMRENGLKDEVVDGYKVTFQIQERSTMNEDKLVKRLKELGLEEAIVTVEKPDEEAISQLIYEGKLAASELQSCVTIKPVEVLKVAEVKK